MNLKSAVQALLDRAEGAVEQRHADTIDAGELIDYLVVDVREDNEFAAGHLPGALSLPRSRLEMACLDCEPLGRHPSKTVLVYCKSGRRSLLAAKTLRELGVEHPISMAGGISAWTAAGKPTHTSDTRPVPSKAV